MMDKKGVRFHNFKTLLEMVGDQQQSDSLYVYFNNEIVKETPFSYPFYSDNHAVILILSGEIKIQVNLITYTAKENEIIIISSRSIVHIKEIINPTEFIGIAFTNDFALKNAMSNDKNGLFFFAVKEKPVLFLSDKERDIFYHLTKFLYNLNLNSEIHFRAERIACYFNLLAYEILAAFRKNKKKLDLKDSRKKELVLEFLNQLSLHSKKERSVRFYADQLSVTPDYLSKVLKEVSGMTTRDIIEESVVMEARTLLESTTMSISQISEYLQFSDQSFFGKFFKRKMKISPHAYRNQRK